MESLKNKIKSAMSDTWVAIKDTKKVNNSTKTGTISVTTYRIVKLEIFNKLKRGVKYRTNKDTNKIEEYEDSNPHIIVELGRSKDKKIAKSFLPNNN